MIEFIPLEYYTPIFYNFILLLVLVVYFQSQHSAIEESKNINRKLILGYLSLVLITIYMGVRPVSGRYFGDMGRYALMFNDYSNGTPLLLDKDILFSIFVYGSTLVMNVYSFFLLCAFLYCYTAYKISLKFFGNYWFYAFLMQAAVITFWGAGTNGIRNALAASCFLWALTRTTNKTRMLFVVGSFLIHGSMLLPAAAYFLSLYVKNTKWYIYFWLLSIPLSLALGSFFESAFFNLGFGAEDRLAGYLTELDEGIESGKTGFRWDFLIYSGIGVFSGWYFIIKKKYEDQIYIQLFNIYLICNAFWVLVIRANFSNRFAYLSWFLLGLVIIYPFLKMKFFHKQHIQVGRIIFGFYMISYVLAMLA